MRPAAPSSAGSGETPRQNRARQLAVVVLIERDGVLLFDCVGSGLEGEPQRPRCGPAQRRSSRSLLLCGGTIRSCLERCPGWWHGSPLVRGVGAGAGLTRVGLPTCAAEQARTLGLSVIALLGVWRDLLCQWSPLELSRRVRHARSCGAGLVGHPSDDLRHESNLAGVPTLVTQLPGLLAGFWLRPVQERQR